jgi:hypothetical protein
MKSITYSSVRPNGSGNPTQIKHLYRISNKLFMALIAALLFTSCGSLTSNTEISANNSFILGNNPHGAFKVKLTNLSSEDIKVFLAPIAGGTHSPQMVKPNETITVKVEKDTALKIENNSNTIVNVGLKVTGDTGLSMGYKN